MAGLILEFKPLGRKSGSNIGVDLFEVFDMGAAFSLSVTPIALMLVILFS